MPHLNLDNTCQGCMQDFFWGGETLTDTDGLLRICATAMCIQCEYLTATSTQGGVN